MTQENDQSSRKEDNLFTMILWINAIWFIIELITWGLSNIRAGGSIWGNLFLPVSGTVILLLLGLDSHINRHWRRKHDRFTLPAFVIWGYVVITIVLVTLRFLQIFVI